MASSYTRRNFRTNRQRGAVGPRSGGMVCTADEICRPRRESLGHNCRDLSKQYHKLNFVRKPAKVVTTPGRLQSQETWPRRRAMVWVGRKAQVLARRGMDIWRGNHPSRRRALSAVLTRLAYISPRPGRRSVWTSSSPTAVLNVMQAVLNAPVVADHLKEFLGCAAPGTQAGQQIPALPAHLPGGYVHPLLLQHHTLPHSWKAQLIPDIVGQCLIGPDAPFLDHAGFLSTLCASGSNGPSPANPSANAASTWGWFPLMRTR